MKELEKQFTGKGEVRGFNFKQLEASPTTYLYEVTDGTSTHYEVFERKVNDRFNTVTYPSAKAFGKWAWTYVDGNLAILSFRGL